MHQTGMVKYKKLFHKRPVNAKEKSMKKYNVLGIGNAVVDVISQSSDIFISHSSNRTSGRTLAD